MTTPGYQVPPFKASLGRPPADSFAADTREVTGDVSLSVEDWIDCHRRSRSNLQRRLGMALHGNPTRDPGLEGALATLSAVVTALTDTDLPIMGYVGTPLEPRDFMFGRRLNQLMYDLPAMGGPAFSDTCIFRRYQAVLANMGDSAVQGTRVLGKLDIALYAETTGFGDVHAWEDGEEVLQPEAWRVLEGIASCVSGPHAYDHEWALDTLMWSTLSPAEQFSVPGEMLARVLPLLPENMGYIVGRYGNGPGGVPIGYARFADAQTAEAKLDKAVRAELSTITRRGIAHTIFQLVASNEMFGTVYASVLVCTRFVRLYVLGANRIAIEIAPVSGELQGTLASRAAVPFSALQTAEGGPRGAYERLPWSLTQNTTVTPHFQSKDHEDDLASEEYFTNRDERELFVTGTRIHNATLDENGVQTYISFGAAATVRMASRSRYQAMTRLATPLQDRYLEDLTQAVLDVGFKHGLPTELLLDISDLALGNKVHDAVDVDEESHHVPVMKMPRIHVEAVEEVLEQVALFIPVTTAEMDALIAAQVQSDLAAYTPMTDPPTRTFRASGADGL